MGSLDLTRRSSGPRPSFPAVTRPHRLYAVTGCRAVVLVLGALLFLVTTEAFADPTSEKAKAAATDAVHAAEAAKRAADAAAAAADKAKEAANTAKEDANAIGNANAAATAANAAAAAAKAAEAAAAAAGRAAAAAQAAAAKSDAAGAAAAAGQAATAAGTAGTQATNAETGAATASDQARFAKQTVANDKANNNVVPTSPAQQRALDGQAQTQDANKTDAGGVADEARRLRKVAQAICDALTRRLLDEEEQGAVRRPGEQPVRVVYTADSFFDIFVEIQLPPVTFPNTQAPLAVPQVILPQGKDGTMRLRLFNGNPFDVVVAGVDGFLFGDAVSFTPPPGPQIVSGGDELYITLGRIAFDGRPYGFTSADFRLVTDGSHPGLGPSFPVNFYVAPEPGSAWLFAAVAAAWLGFARVRGGWTTRRR